MASDSMRKKLSAAKLKKAIRKTTGQKETFTRPKQPPQKQFLSQAEKFQQMGKEANRALARLRLKKAQEKAKKKKGK